MKNSLNQISKFTLGQTLSLVFLTSLLLAIPLTFLKRPISTASKAQKPPEHEEKCPPTAPLLQKTCDDGYWQAKTDPNNCPYVVCQKFEQQEISPTLLLKGSWAKSQKDDRTLQTNEDYLKILKENLNLTDKKKIPKVDFKTQTVIAVFLGETTKDYQIEIEKIIDQGNKILVSLKETPQKALSTKPTTYHPFIIFKIPKTDKEIKFKH